MLKYNTKLLGWIQPKIYYFNNDIYRAHGYHSIFLADKVRPFFQFVALLQAVLHRQHVSNENMDEG